METRRSYVDETFRGIIWRDRPLVLQDYALARCTFRGCHLQSLKNPSERAIVRNVSLTQCDVFGESCSMSGAIVEDCIVDGLSAGGLIHIDGCAFKHVTIRGAVGRIMLTNAPLSLLMEKDLKQAFVEANASYYADVDWALDISEAMPTVLECRGIPGRLIRRDLETQVLIRREALLDGAWKQLELDSLVRTWLSYLIRMGWDDGVFVVPARGRRRRELLGSMLILRRAGIAEPD